MLKQRNLLIIAIIIYICNLLHYRLLICQHQLQQQTKVRLLGHVTNCRMIRFRITSSRDKLPCDTVSYRISGISCGVSGVQNRPYQSQSNDKQIYIGRGMRLM